MKLLLAIAFGFLLGSAFTVSAQFWSSDDNRGNRTSGYPGGGDSAEAALLAGIFFYMINAQGLVQKSGGNRRGHATI